MALRDHQVLVLVGETGSGKTTQSECMTDLQGWRFSPFSFWNFS